nr:MAG TPA: hypothetical protein [Bacteriophage sp.]
MFNYFLFSIGIKKKVPQVLDFHSISFFSYYIYIIIIIFNKKYINNVALETLSYLYQQKININIALNQALM